MNILPGSSSDGAARRERSEAGSPGGAGGDAFPRYEDETRSDLPPWLRSWVPSSLSVGVPDSPSHPVQVIIRPTVGRAVAAFLPSLTPAQKLRKAKRRSGVTETTGIDWETGEIIDLEQLDSAWSRLSLDQRMADSQRRTTSRASSEMTDYMVHNRLTKMWVLTNADELHGRDGRREMMRRVSGFMRRLRRSLMRGRDFPYLYSPELHPGGHGWHCNLFLQSIFLDKHQVQRLWGHGNVWYSDFMTHDRDWLGRKLRNRGGGSGSTRAAARAAARYGAAYAQKDWDPVVCGPGAHRYERAQGFSPPEQRVRVESFNDFYALLQAHPGFGSMFASWALDCDTPGWLGPVMRGVLFDPPDSRVKGRAKRERRSDEGAAGATLDAAGTFACASWSVGEGGGLIEYEPPRASRRRTLYLPPSPTEQRHPPP